VKGEAKPLDLDALEPGVLAKELGAGLKKAARSKDRTGVPKFEECEDAGVEQKEGKEGSKASVNPAKGRKRGVSNEDEL